MSDAASPARRRLVLLAAAAATIVAALAWRSLTQRPTALQRALEGRAVPASDGILEASLSLAAGQYTPNVVHAAAGRPLRLRIERGDGHSCADRILIPDLRVAGELAGPGTTVVLVPAARRGEYLFTCGSRMVKGVLLFE